MARYHGKKGVVYMSTTGSGTAVAVGNLTEWSISYATDRIDVTSFGDTNRVYVQGLRNVTGSFKGWFDDSATKALFDAADSADGIKMYLYPSADAATRYFYGTAFVDTSIQTGVAGAVSISGTFAAAGGWDYKLA